MTTLPSSAPALVVTAHGGRDVLAVEDRPLGSPGAAEALVEVAAGGVNFIDVYQREGVYPGETPFVLGQEGAGTVVAAGEDSGVAVGDRVVWSSVMGSHAAYAVVPGVRLVPVPDGVDLRTAAAVMLQGMTAHYLATSTYPVRSGDTVVVHAAAGGVGQLLVQMAKARGARVVATAGGPEKCAIASALGADATVDTRSGDDLAATLKEAVGEGAHVVYDGVGLATWEASLGALRRRGMFVLFGGASGQVPPFDLQRLNRGGSLYATRPNLADYIVTREELLARAGEVLGWVADGSLTVAEPTAYPLAEAAAAYAALEGRETTGKLVLVP